MVQVMVEEVPWILEAAIADIAGATLSTVTVTEVAVVGFPAASRARAVRVCEALVDVVVSQVME